MNQAERDAKIEEYGRGPFLLAAALAEIPREAWVFQPAPKEWNVNEILVHMADSEMMGVIRLYKLISEPGETLMPYEAGIWGEVMRYVEQDGEDAFQLFMLARRKTYQVLMNLPENVYANTLVHPEKELNAYTLERWLDIYVGHVPEHIEQIENNVKAWEERKQ